MIMKRNLLPAISGTILLIAFTFGCRMKPVSEGVQTYDGLKKLFVDPPSEYRSAPLWDWNDKITEKGIDFHMNKFKEGGIGGVFIHPRPGLVTEYLSEDWNHLFDYAVRKGKELGMKSYTLIHKLLKGSRKNPSKYNYQFSYEKVNSMKNLLQEK